jgi:hypothetical protein
MVSFFILSVAPSRKLVLSLPARSTSSILLDRWMVEDVYSSWRLKITCERLLVWFRTCEPITLFLTP